MFGFLKNKLKEWVDKAKDTLKPEEEKSNVVIEEKEVKPKEEKISKKQEIKEKKKEEKKTKKDKIIESESKFEKLVEEAKKKEQKKEKVPEIQKEEKESLEEKEFEITEEIEEKQKLPELPEEPTTKKQGFISQLFGKKSKIEEKEIPPISEKIIKPETEEEKSLEQKKSFFQKVKSSFTYKITQDDFNKLFNDLEMLLLENNVALEVVEDLKKSLSTKLISREIKKDNLENEIKTELKNSLNELIIDPQNPLDTIKLKKEKPFVILFFGTNGAGKTTSIAKIANLLKENNMTVVLAAADTFRAASIEQIQEHANKLQIPLIKHNYQSDPAAVGFDAIKYAKTHRIDIVLIDTAGRMHTKTNLLSEMEKICRVTSPDLKIFVAESIAGNDATEQSKAFNDMIGIDGSILSKADVDEKGGTIISVSHATKKPIIYLGTGQTYKDLKFFNKKEYIESLGL